MSAHCGQIVAWKITETFADNFKIEVNRMFEQTATNCTPYIAQNFLSLLVKYEYQILNGTDTVMHVPDEYLIDCLRAELPKTNWTSPFRFAPNASMQYNIAINEVLSLGFDGVLVTKACSGLCSSC